MRHEQLLEVYGMDSSLFGMLQPYIELDTTRIRHLMLNSQSKFELMRHPYLDRQTALKIIHYRDFAGSISGLDELIDKAGIGKSEIRMIAPYLRYDSLTEISPDSID